MAEITFREAKELFANWSKGSFPTVSESIKYHFAQSRRRSFNPGCLAVSEKIRVFCAKFTRRKNKRIRSGFYAVYEKRLLCHQGQRRQNFVLRKRKIVKSELKEKLRILQELYKSDFLRPFPYEDCQKILAKIGVEFEDFIPSLDVYCSDVAGYCSWGERMDGWSIEKNESVKNQLQKSFFQRFPRFSDLQSKISEKETPKLYNQLLVYDLMRLTLVDILAELNSEKNAQTTQLSQLPLAS